jgi:hypothetical protein
MCLAIAIILLCNIIQCQDFTKNAIVNRGVFLELICLIKQRIHEIGKERKFIMPFSATRIIKDGLLS